MPPVTVPNLCPLLWHWPKESGHDMQPDKELTGHGLWCVLGRVYLQGRSIRVEMSDSLIRRFAERRLFSDRVSGDHGDTSMADPDPVEQTACCMRR